MFEKTLEFKVAILLSYDKQKNIEFIATSFKSPSVGHCWSCHYVFESNGIYMCAKLI